MSGPGRGRADFLQIGDWNAVCSMCGRKRKASTMVQNWQGMWRCPEHNEPRQPQDFVRGIADIQTPPWVQPPQDINVQVCTFNGISAIPGYSIPGCMLPGNGSADFDYYPPIPPETPAELAWTTTQGGYWTTSQTGSYWTITDNTVPQPVPPTPPVVPATAWNTSQGGYWTTTEGGYWTTE